MIPGVKRLTETPASKTNPLWQNTIKMSARTTYVRERGGGGGQSKNRIARMCWLSQRRSEQKKVLKLHMELGHWSVFFFFFNLKFFLTSLPWLTFYYNLTTWDLMTSQLVYCKPKYVWWGRRRRKALNATQKKRWMLSVISLISQDLECHHCGCLMYMM